MAKYDFWIDPPIMNAAGSLGFMPDRRIGQDWSRFGVYITNPISLGPRNVVQGTRFVPFPGGFLLHTGYPNPGIREALRRFGPTWSRSEIPVIVHLLAQTPDEVSRMVHRLEGLEGVIGVEIGLPPRVSTQTARELLEAAVGELLVLARLPFEQALELTQTAAEAGAAAISLSPPRGVLAASDGQLVEGRLYGPAILPLALQVTRQLTELGLPVLAAGGIYSTQDIQLFMHAGAAAVQLDSWLWYV